MSNDIKVGDQVTLPKYGDLVGTVDAVFPKADKPHEIPRNAWAWIKWHNGNDGAVDLHLLRKVD